MVKKNKLPRGRPARPMPDPIPDTPENVARIVLQAPKQPKDGWDYLKKAGQPGKAAAS